MRRISTGVQGRPILGKYFSVDNVLSTLETNTDIRLEPSGSGKVIADSDVRIASGNSLEIVSDSSANSVNLVAPSGMGTNFDLTLPSADGANGTVLATDGSGNLSFVNVAVEINNQTADTTTYYPTMSTSTTGGITDLSVSSSKLSFQPSSGTLTVTDVSATDGDFSGTVTVSNDLTVTNDFSAGTITETSSIALKTDITPIENALDSIAALTGVSYTRRATGRRESGLIAEEVEKVLPEIVSDTGEYKSISYSRLTAYLAEAVKSLRQEIQELKGNR
jgi:hypothetical protein